MMKSDPTISVIGNCQATPIAECLGVMLPNSEIHAGFSRDMIAGLVDLDDLIGKSDILIVQTPLRGKVDTALAGYGGRKPEIFGMPAIFHTGFHPDFVYARCAGQHIRSAFGRLQSAIILYAWKSGLDREHVFHLFSEEVFAALGYFDYVNKSNEVLLEDAQSMGLDLADELRAWTASGPFMLTPLHPRFNVIAGLSRALLKRIGIEPKFRYPENFIQDKLSQKEVLPIYPEIAARLGSRGEYVFKFSETTKGDKTFPPRVLDLAGFIDMSFAALDGLDPAVLDVARFEDARYATLLGRDARGLRSRARGTHPYRGLPTAQFWDKSVAGVTPAALDPVVAPRIRIAAGDRIATAGSCFAQHIARALQGSGYRYHVVESGAHLSAEDAKVRQYGVFSARYGNIYTAKQLAQLIDRANGAFVPADTAWARADGRLVDPFRPQVEPAGFGSVEEVEQARAEHLAHVRILFGELDVFVFTLGLTEAWRSKRDGAVFPVAPGVAGGEMDFDRYEFHNFSVDETVAAMRYFIAELRKLNPAAKVMLTVSPVPLAATYEATHVLSATTYSKSVLRVAADILSRTVEDVEYFPSYEIITGAFNRGAYFDEDLRSIRSEGVAHVMGRFLAHHTIPPDGGADDGTPPHAAAGRSREFVEGQDIICEEELLAKV